MTEGKHRMSIAAFKGLGRPVAAVAAAIMLMGAGASAASAASITVSPSTGLGTSATVGVVGSGFAASTEFRLGTCSTRAYGAMGIPACGGFIPVTSNGSGGFTASLPVTQVFTNVHARIPFPINLGQPASITCLGTTGDQCAVSVASHGGTPSILARQNVTF